MIRRQHTRVRMWLDSRAVGTGPVRVIDAVMAFIANDRVEYADLEVKPVHDGSAQDHVGLLDGEIGRV